MSEQRYFENPYLDYEADESRRFLKESCSPVDVNGYQTLKLDSLLGQNIQSVSINLLESIQEAYFMSGQSGRRADCSVYTGISGIYFLYKEIGCPWDEFILSQCLSSPQLKPYLGFLCGISGPLAFAAAYSVHKDTYLKQFLSLRHSKLFSDSPEEFLYGKAGYLYALLLVKREHPLSNEVDELIKDVASIIIQNGCRKSSVLYYEWHRKEYIGAAHGYAGILLSLLRAKAYLNPEQLSLVLNKIEELLEYQLDNGNFPPSIRSLEDDRLVHWCHGAPGMAELYFLSYEIFEDPKYLRVAEGCLDTIWERGLLKKGLGLCHGASGNGYAFLLGYKTTKNPKHLYRALRFAEWCVSHLRAPLSSVPDNPYSLFEGLAGTLFFLHHIQQGADKAYFPCYS